LLLLDACSSEPFGGWQQVTQNLSKRFTCFITQNFNIHIFLLRETISLVPGREAGTLRINSVSFGDLPFVALNKHVTSAADR
jgi:hypothetical protein